MTETTNGWPKLDFAALEPTAETLRLFTQVAGKVRLARTPWVNHSWHVTLYVSARGLTTSLIPNGASALELEFDFIAGVLAVRTTSGEVRRVPLASCSVAGFYAAVMDALAAVGAPTTIDETPNERPEGDRVLAGRRAAPLRCGRRAAVSGARWLQVERVFLRFRSRFLVQGQPHPLCFWGSFDLAVTRFSGRRAPLHPGGVPSLPDAVAREAYSHEVSSAGFWPGGGGVEEPSFYAYAYPAPEGFAAAPVSPAAARFDPALGEFLLPYEAVRTAADPDAALLAFLQSTYEAAADRAGWDRAALECGEGQLGVPRPVD